MPRKAQTLYCSFCGKSQHDVKKLIAGPKVFICDECVECCIGILAEDRDWCDLEIENIKRLKKQARSRAAAPAPEDAAPAAKPRWFGRLFHAPHS